MQRDLNGKTPLRLQREALGKTQAQVAYESGLTEKSYRDIENSDVMPALDTAVNIAKALGMGLVEFAKQKGLDVSGLPDLNQQKGV
jgi:transcriptional regulator with XRE-family HTH domain